MNILEHLHLPALRALKTTSKNVANLCRRVLRSDAWQGLEGNYEDLYYDISGSIDTLSFPLTVTIMPYHFVKNGISNPFIDLQEGTKHLIATIHRLKLICVNDEWDRIPLESNWKDVIWGKHRIGFIDLCMDFHGYGIVSSEEGMRSIILSALQQRGRRLCRKTRNNRENTATERLVNMLLYDIIDEMNVVVPVSKKHGMSAIVPIKDWTEQLTLADLMKLKLGPFSEAHTT